MIRVLVDFSLGGIECRWCACLCAGARNGVGPAPERFERGEGGGCLCEFGSGDLKVIGFMNDGGVC